MAEIWGAAIAVGGAVVSGIAAEKKAKADRANANTDRAAATRESALYEGVLSQFERQQDDFYSQLNRSRKQRGLDVFRQFSTVNQFAPNYQAPAQAQIVVPENPNIATSLDVAVRQDQANQEAAGQQQEQKSGRSTFKKVADPLGLF